MSEPIPPDVFRNLYPNASESAINAVQRAWDDWQKGKGESAFNPVHSPDPVRSETPSPVPECVVFDEPVGAAQGETQNPARYILRIQSLRVRLCDPDNLVGGTKYYCDALRYLGILPDDSEKVLSLHVSQTKVKTKAEETTFIEVIPPCCQ